MNEEELQGRFDVLDRSRVTTRDRVSVENWDQTEEAPAATTQEPSTSANKKSKKKSRLSDAISKVKPTFDPSTRDDRPTNALPSSPFV